MPLTINVAPGAVNTTINVISTGSANVPMGRISIVSVGNSPDPTVSRSRSPVQSVFDSREPEVMTWAVQELKGIVARIKEESTDACRVSSDAESTLAHDLCMVRLLLSRPMREGTDNYRTNGGVALRQLQNCRKSHACAIKSCGGEIHSRLAKLAAGLKAGMEKLDVARPAVLRSSSSGSLKEFLLAASHDLAPFDRVLTLSCQNDLRRAVDGACKQLRVAYGDCSKGSFSSHDREILAWKLRDVLKRAEAYGNIVRKPLGDIIANLAEFSADGSRQVP
jgi:hypothetical protein